jgi:hypothetical protein
MPSSSTAPTTKSGTANAGATRAPTAAGKGHGQSFAALQAVRAAIAKVKPATTFPPRHAVPLTFHATTETLGVTTPPSAFKAGYPPVSPNLGIVEIGSPSPPDATEMIEGPA